MIQNSKFPLKLKILKGKIFKGSLIVKNKENDGRYFVAFDATSEKSCYEKYIYDRGIMTKEKIKEWTGEELNE